MAFRRDTGTLAAPTRLPDGRLVVEATLTKPGVFPYRNADGSTRYEYRSPEEMARSRQSFALVPVTDDHPPVMLNATNAKHYTVGQVVEVRDGDDEHMVGKLVINDATTIAKMDNGKREVSNGYACELDETPGVSPEGVRYDVRQFNIRGNHVAIVNDGRVGTARIRMDDAGPDRWDDADRADEPAPDSATPASASVAVSTRADGALTSGAAAKKDHMNLEQALAALAAAQEKLGAEKSRADAAEKKSTELEVKLTSAEQATAVEKTRADAADKAKVDAETARKDAADKFDAQVAARVALNTAALCLRNDKGEMPDITKMTNRDLKVAIVKKLDGFEIPADRSDAAVDTAFEMASARAEKAGAALGAARAATTLIPAAARADGNDAEAKAKAAMTSSYSNAWKNEKETK